MSRESRRRKLENDLAALERRFSEHLRVALRACADGEWGLFGQNDAVLRAHFGNTSARYGSASAQLLNELAAEIARTRTQLGYTQANMLCERYAAYRSHPDPNSYGEPKLALEFLAELEAAHHPMKP